MKYIRLIKAQDVVEIKNKIADFLKNESWEDEKDLEDIIFNYIDTFAQGIEEGQKQKIAQELFDMFTDSSDEDDDL